MGFGGPGVAEAATVAEGMEVNKIGVKLLQQRLEARDCNRFAANRSQASPELHWREKTLVGFAGLAGRMMFRRWQRLMRRPEHIQGLAELELGFEQLMYENFRPPRDIRIKGVREVKNADGIFSGHNSVISGSIDLGTKR